MSLSNEQKKHYRTIGHDLNPIVTISSKGLSDTVLLEIERALNDHELIKIKVVAEDKSARKELTESISKQTKSAIIQEIGKVALIYRAAKTPNKKLSNLMR